jgi:hypothetical protein
LHTFSRPRQNIVGDRRLCNGCPWWRRQCRLQSPDGAVEGQAVRLEDVRRGAAPIPDDRGKNNRAVNIPSPAAASRRSSGLENAAHILGNADARRYIFRIGGRLGKLPDDVGFERSPVNVARVEHCHGVRIVAQRCQQMLERHVGRTGGRRKFGAARQRCTEVWGHRNLCKVSSSYGHNVSQDSIKMKSIQA